jgi:hypothetical protein
MTTDVDKAKEDLAFLRAIVEDQGGNNKSFGIVYGSAGALYGLQCVANWALLASDTPAPTIVWMLVGWLPTILFLAINFAFVWKDRKAPFGTGASRRALNAAFAGAGISNLILALIFGFIAYQRRDWSIWFLYPVVVCALQGAVWFMAAILFRRSWYGLSAAGWFVAAILLGMFIEQTHTYLLVLGLALFLLMGLPGYIMLRGAKD